MKTKAIRIHETGGPEVLRWEEVEIGEPGPGEVRIRQTAIGVNFLDTYHRSGLYKLPLPAGLGSEAAGVVDAVGPQVEGFTVGDRVVYGGGPVGSYSEMRLFPADRLVPLPSWIDDQSAAALLLKGMTAEYLLCRTHEVQRDEQVLIHAAAGATGGIMCQWAKSIGAHVIGAVGSEGKVAIAEDHGADHVVVTSDDNWSAKVRDFTDGVGVAVVYDSVGKATFEGSLSCLKTRGLMVSFGNASGPVPPFSLVELNAKGSLYITRPSLQHYTAERKDMMESAASVFDKFHQGAIKPTIAQTFPLKDAAEAHRALEGRGLTGSVILLP